MQNMKNYIFYLAALLFLGLNSCQDEEESASTTPQGLTQSSTLSSLVSRVSQFPTAIDNILDGQDCFGVVLPVSLTVNGTAVDVNTTDDYQKVRTIINQYSDDDDVIHFSFPITIKYKNYQQVVITSQEQYQSIVSACAPNNSFCEIACIDFNYPVVINAYNIATQTPTTITITSNTQLYNFIQGLTTDQIYSIVYPLSMTKSNSEVVVYNSNAALQAGIESTIDDCNTVSIPTTLSEIIASGTWYVSSFIHDTTDETYYFNGYNFTFSSNGTSIAEKNTTTINGTWSHFMDDGNSTIDLSFDGDFLDEIEEDWRVLEYSETLIKLRCESVENEEVYYLSFSKN
jgi:hypothetical protein